MNNGNVCINGVEIASVYWKIGNDPWSSNIITPFTQGDVATALLRVELDDCGTFEGKTLEAFVQVPNPNNDIVKIHSTVDFDNKAIFTLPVELLWWPGDYTINFMFTEGSKVNYSNVLNNAYTVNENPALAGEDPPTILPGDIAEYEQLISELNAENTRAETNLPLLEAENVRAEANIIAAGNINTELEGTIADAETAKTDLEDTITNSETAKSNLEQTITDSETAKSNLETTITDSETAKINLEQTIVDAGQAQSDLQDKIDEVPTLIQDITDEGTTQVNRVIAEGTTQKGEVTTEGNTQVSRVEATGSNEVSKVTDEGNLQQQRIINQGNTEISRVQSQGTTSLNAVKSQETTSIIAVGDKGDEEYQRLNDLIQTSPQGGNAMLLDGRTRTSFEEDIESRAYTLDNRLIYAFVPVERNLENLKYGVHIDNPLTNGDGTIKSEDADSLAGVFNDEDGSFYCGEGYTAGSEPVGAPLVKESAPDGKIIIKEPWTSENHSFIFHNFNFIGKDANSCFYLCDNVVSDTERLQIEGNYNSAHAILSKSALKVYDENFVELIGARLIRNGLTNNSITIGHPNLSRTTNEVGGIFVYEGDLTEQELRKELDKIKSGKYYLENAGVYEPVQGALKRANEYGRMKDYVYISNNSTDIQLVETNKIVTTSIDGVTKRDVIDNLGLITGDGGVVDVNGYIRLTANDKTKVVIEVD